MKSIRQFLLSLFLFLPLLLAAQKGALSGKIIDAKLAEGLIGASVRLDEGAGGAVTDLDGNFTIRNVEPGAHKITINYTGYQTKVIDNIQIKPGETATLEIALEEYAAQAIAEVVIVANAGRESMTALTILQKNSPTIADGISAETIKRTPDRTTGDVIRRVSGASIQDNKFAVIRGLADRYNIAMLNGAMLPSTEPDRKAFSFDLFPSAMLDNLVVMKTASADLPGDFAGGVIMLNTRDIPEENYVSVNVSGGYNNVTTFKPYLSAPGGNTDWLGFDDGTRALPANFPGVEEFKQLSIDRKAEATKLLPNDWAITENNSARPNLGMQIAAGFVTDPAKKVQWGTTFALSYNNNNRLQDGLRADYDQGTVLQFRFNDQVFRNNVLWGGLFNTSVKINNRHKITLQGTYSTNTDNTVVSREGEDIEQERMVRTNTIEFTENHLLTTRLSGEHTLSESGIRLSWGGGFNQSTRDVPSLRRMYFFKNLGAPESQPYIAAIAPNGANLNLGGRFYSALQEDVANGNVDLTVPFKLAGVKQSLKVGGLYQRKERDFNARVTGFIRAASGFNSSLLTLPQDQIFAPENIGPKGFRLDEITNPNDKYNAGSDLAAAYVMFDNTVYERLRLSWGLRVEHFSQNIQSALFGGELVDETRTTTDFLPSANLTYQLNEKHQIRLSGSRTVSRPEFRELAPFAFYDFLLSAAVQGNPALTPGNIYNADLRYEIYPGQNQLFSVSAFYKKFNDPVEFTFSSLGAGTRTFTFQNINSAQNYGLELELRKNFDFLGANWEDLVFFSNAALIRSTLDLSNTNSYDPGRALQGQSPYIVNAGLTYTLRDWGLASTLVYNVIGDRVAQVGATGYADIYERARNLLDFQLSKRFGERGEVKLTWGDILRPDFMYYQDNNRNHKYDDNEDNVMQRLNFGSTITLSLGYRF